MTDCIYYNDGKCAKGLPNTPCEIKGCVAYMKKSEAYACIRVDCWHNKFGAMCDKVNCADRIPPLKDKK